MSKRILKTMRQVRGMGTSWISVSYRSWEGMWGTEESKRQGHTGGRGLTARTSHLQDKEHPATKGATVLLPWAPPLKHKTEPLFCPLGTIPISFWKGCFKKRKCFFSFWSSPRKGRMWVPVTSRHLCPAPTCQVAVLPRTTFWKHLPNVCRMTFCAGCWAQRAVVLVLKEPTSQTSKLLGLGTPSKQKFYHVPQYMSNYF